MNQAIDTQALALIFSIGAFLIALICLYAVIKKQETPKIQPTKPKKPKRSNEPILRIRPEFIKEVESEKRHRREQRRKYGIFDDDGNRIDKSNMNEK